MNNDNKKSILIAANSSIAHERLTDAIAAIMPNIDASIDNLRVLVPFAKVGDELQKWADANKVEIRPCFKVEAAIIITNENPGEEMDWLPFAQSHNLAPCFFVVGVMPPKVEVADDTVESIAPTQESRGIDDGEAS